MVLIPSFSVAKKVTVSPACNVSSDKPSCALNSSAAPPVFAPTVPLCDCLIATVRLIRSTWVTVPVSASWAKAELMMVKVAVPAKMTLAIFMADSRWEISRDDRIGSSEEQQEGGWHQLLDGSVKNAMVSCPLWVHFPTSRRQTAMSALCQ